MSGWRCGLDEWANVAQPLNFPELRDKRLRARRAEYRLDQFDELRLQAGIVERHDARTERLVGLAREPPTPGRHRHARRAQFGIEPIDLGWRRNGEALGELREGRIVAGFGVEVIHFDAAIARREAHQIREA